MNTIEVYIKQPGRDAARIAIPNEFREFQRAVDGYIECVTVAPGLTVICDEDGRLKGKEVNCELGDVLFVGTVLVVGTEPMCEEFLNVPDEEVVKALLPELFEEV